MKNKSLILPVLCMIILVLGGMIQFRPMNWMNHPGLLNPYHPPQDGQNHRGVSDYGNRWMGFSELCEDDMQYRPANQGKNILKFYICDEDSDE